ncbi:MAG: DUF2946 family protein [Pseudomonadota bacterium]
MDESVKQALLKWPNVPHCFGWLGLDARGRWRMRDEQAQAGQLAGDIIAHVALQAFINRNYGEDQAGCWYFQNGPQRVYVDLAACPFIAHTDGQQRLVLHTGEPLDQIDAVWISESGKLLFQSGTYIAQLDDRDLAQCLPWLRNGDAMVSDEELMDWLDAQSKQPLSLIYAGKNLPVQTIADSEIAQRFGFICTPRPT